MTGLEQRSSTVNDGGGAGGVNDARCASLPGAGRGRRGARVDEYALARAAVRVAGWPGEVLPFTEVLGVDCYPVIEATGFDERLAAGQPPYPDLTLAEMWERWPEDLPETPPRPLRIVGFVSPASWSPAMRAVRALSGLGSGMLLAPGAVSRLRMLEADARGVWVATAQGGSVDLRVIGRTGPVPTARRVPLTRVIEERLFSHALEALASPLPIRAVPGWA